MRRRRAVAAGVAAVLVGGAAAAVVLGGDDGPAGRPSTARGRTALVKRRNLVSRVTIDGQLGYADQRKVAARLAGTLTWLAPEGSVVAPGHSLYRLDDVRVLLLDGDRPAWRAFTPGMSDGRDVLELETNLSALGYDPYGAMTVDEDWTAATTAAVKRFQEHVGLDDTGTLELGRIVFLPGARRVSQHNLSIGDAAGPGGPVLTTTSTRRVVAANLSADDQGAAHRGDRALVDLPDGRRVRGTISAVGAVAQAGQDGGATIAVTVALPPHGVPRLDKAPVSVSIARQRLRRVSAVPVVALLARPGGGYGVELVEHGRRRLVRVTPGLFADGWVQVDGVRPGQRVAVPGA